MSPCSKSSGWLLSTVATISECVPSLATSKRSWRLLPLEPASIGSDGLTDEPETLTSRMARAPSQTLSVERSKGLLWMFPDVE